METRIVQMDEFYDYAREWCKKRGIGVFGACAALLVNALPSEIPEKECREVIGDLEVLAHLVETVTNKARILLVRAIAKNPAGDGDATGCP